MCLADRPAGKKIVNFAIQFKRLSVLKQKDDQVNERGSNLEREHFAEAALQQFAGDHNEPCNVESRPALLVLENIRNPKLLQGNNFSFCWVETGDRMIRKTWQKYIIKVERFQFHTDARLS